MTIRNFIQNHIIGILITGLVYGIGFVIRDAIRVGFKLEELAVIPAAAIYLGAFAAVLSLPYFLIMVLTIARNHAEPEILNKKIRTLQIILSLIVMAVVFLISNSLQEGLVMNGIVMGYAITGTILMFYPIKTLYINRNKMQKL